MSIDRRKQLLSELENELDARVITLVTGDRAGMETRIAPDILALVTAHLTTRPDGDRIALFLYTPGGDSIVGWGVVNLLREYANTLIVLVPFKAQSCGTLIAMGADELYMGRRGLLSPIDPSVNSPYNPPQPGPGAPPGKLLPVSVEDMAGFLDLAQELGLTESVEVLKILAEKVHPLALGAVHRAREQAGSLASRLLGLHMDDEERIERIVRQLTRELPTHNYLIGRKEAQDIGLELSVVSDALEESTWNLYSEYESWLKLTEPYSQLLDIGAENTKRVRYERAAVEMLDGHVLEQYKYITDKELLRIPAAQPGSGEQIGERIVYQGWRRLHDQEDNNGIAE